MHQSSKNSNARNESEMVLHFVPDSSSVGLKALNINRLKYVNRSFIHYCFFGFFCNCLTIPKFQQCFIFQNCDGRFCKFLHSYLFIYFCFINHSVPLRIILMTLIWDAAIEMGTFFMLPLHSRV